jgi:hypothetical protein
MAEIAMGVETLSVEGDDARRLLAAMLERVQAEDGMGGGFLDTIDADDAALFFQLVVVEGVRREHDPDRRP